MKTLVKFILALAVIGFFTACNSSGDFNFEDDPSFKHHEDKMVTLGFNVLLYGTYQDVPENDDCPGLGKVINTGEGTGTHFKKVTSYFEFCVKPTVPGGGTYPEGYIDAYFEDANGDRLFVEVSGEVFVGRVPGMPSYALSYFKDPFTITGGTGKFEGASGSGYTNDYNFFDKKDDGNVHTSHHWQGTITMRKGK